MLKCSEIKVMRIGLILGLWIILGTSMGFADSLWTNSGASLYNTVHVPKAGDVITVVIKAESTAVQEAGTRTSKRSDVGASFYDLWDQYSVNADDNYDSQRKMQDYRLGGGDSFSGTGTTTRKSKVKAIVTAVVTEILSNGNLVVVGERQVNVNNDIETIRISGIIRPQDISPGNTIESHQIAQLQMSLKGEGAVNSKQTPGIMTKMFNWMF
ncbi:flagellar basal body L-ring protein FlgH [bacterium]|jgi:flagellar L-ring protein FlgH|nr:flagellar basal body L-ring protein FlgH [bacterium]